MSWSPLYHICHSCKSETFVVCDYCGGSDICSRGGCRLYNSFGLDILGRIDICYLCMNVNPILRNRTFVGNAVTFWQEANFGLSFKDYIKRLVNHEK